MVTKKRVLLIEDDPKSLYAMKSVLESKGVEVQAFASAEEALHRNGQDVDSAVIDVRLPNQSGPEFAKELRERHPNVRIIFVTAYNNVAVVQAAIPGSALLVKPLDMDALAKLL